MLRVSDQVRPRITDRREEQAAIADLLIRTTPPLEERAVVYEERAVIYEETSAR
jgi:hypothetical protein